MEILEWIIVGIAIPLLSFVGKIAYDYGMLKSTNQNILTKLDEFINRSTDTSEKIEKKIDENESKISILTERITRVETFCKSNHKERD